MPTRKIQSVDNYDIYLFDFDGTLIDNMTQTFLVCNKMLTEFYKLPPITLERFRKTITVPWKEFYYLNGVVRNSIDINKHQIKYQIYDRETRKNNLVLKNGVLVLFSYLINSNKRIGLLSARNTEDLKNEVIKLKIESYFECIVGAESIFTSGVSSYKTGDVIINKMNISKTNNVVYVGDMIQDAYLAEEYGWDCCLLGDGWQDTSFLMNVPKTIYLPTFHDLVNDLVNKF